MDAALQRRTAGDCVVCVAEDDDQVRELYTLVLRSAGMEVVGAADGIEALRIARTVQPDVLVLDNTMPGMFGEEVVRRLRDSDATRTMPVIMVTGCGDESRRLAGLALGANDYLVKPVSSRELVARVRGQLRIAESWSGQMRRQSELRHAVGRILRELPGDEHLSDTARRLVPELTRVLGATGAAILSFSPDGQARSLAAIGSLRSTYPPSDLVRARHARQLWQRSAEGPWVQLAHSSLADIGSRRELAHFPLENDRGVVGMLVLAAETDERDHATTWLSTRSLELADAADAISTALGPRFRTLDLGDARASLQGVLDAGAFTPWFQPIVDLRTAETVAFEALTRFRDGTPPADLFRQAGEAGLGEEFELRTLIAAVEAATDLPSGAALHLNVSPRVLTQSHSLADVVRRCPRQVVLELTEHDPILDCDVMRDRLRALGSVMLAVDDAGSGYASLAHILALAPDFVKLGSDLVSGVSTDPVRRSLLAGLGYFVDQLGGGLIAEGVETEPDMQVLVDLGVGFAQGYYLGRPAEARRWRERARNGHVPRTRIPEVTPASCRPITNLPSLLPRSA